jgi:hypothetical protein
MGGVVVEYYRSTFNLQYIGAIFTEFDHHFSEKSIAKIPSLSLHGARRGWR